ncbi:cyclic nucleotide-binding domain protein (macronuclear) [Tetrahymena thermophila SB210]|uniref:Cyclic nucleotide-binding domain protein n=1 Tax=Tetrahymena thermophila (strain SB210) TaxID=312017 RepID=Q22UP8_TETTS|nr:cyclic nucleotide-binding domain protein [Tetrahymena thermophila SB210]EAR88922.3 cyclic nucleotide-binding domain protein [Tetrahymena thermophila SB210]|eukprot:XP_001009167.3 cyclic nucleotide-binding domain protein [Tetrahymena thermophila SB210]
MSPKQKRFYYVFTLKENQKHIIKLINQLISVITVAHIAAIGWYFIGVQEIVNNYPTNWLDKLGISSYLYYEKYIYSIYWSITTMTTVGYGDIAASNYIEALFIAISMILFSCVFAYSINNIGFILQEIEKSSKQLNDNITTIQRYLNRKNVNISLKSRVRHYLSFLAQEQKDRNKEQEDQIMSILSNKLRDEITIEINSKILSNYHIFSSNFSQTTLKKLVFRMKEVLVSPNEVIFSDEQFDDLSIYFIQNGVIEIYQQSIVKQGKVSVIQTLTENQLFGEISFFSGLSRKASARSVNLSTLYKISREDFLEVLKENDEDFERFKMMQEQINFQNELQILYTECYTCKQVGHIAKNCPKTHHLFDKQFIMLKSNISFFQDRVYYERRQIRLKQKASFLVKQNSNICNMLKENLENLNTEIYFLFNTEENLNGSEFTISEDQEEDEEEEEDDDESDVKSQQTFKSQKSASASQKNQLMKKKTIKGTKNVNISPQKINKNTFFNENEQPQEAQQKDKQTSNIPNEHQDSSKNISYSQNKLNSMEIKENNTNHLITEQSNDSSNLNNSPQQENKQSQKRDSISQNSNPTDIQQIKSNDSIDQGSRSPGRNKKQKNLPNRNKVGSNNFQYSFNINKVSNKFIEDVNQENQSIDFQKQQPGSDKISQVISQYQSSFNNSKRLFSQNSTKTLNIENTEFRTSIDQILLQGMIANTIIQAQRQSLIQKKSNNQQNILQDVLEKCSYQKSRNEICEADNNTNKRQGSNRSIIDHREEKSIKNLSNLNPISRSNSSNINNNNNNNSNIPNSNININNGNNNNNKKKLSENNQIIEDMKFVERFSRLMQTTQLPLLLQYTSGLSLKEMHSMSNINSMDYFEKIRQNIVMPQNQTRISSFNLNSGQIKFGLLDFNIDKYKPTYLSYGVSMRNGMTYPKNNFN